MARSIKRGLDYFSLDVGMLADRKVRRVVYACGAQAVAVILSVWCCAYHENGYYAKTDGEFCFDIASGLNVGEDYVRSVLNKCVETGLFDKGLYERHGVLTSRRMQNNYLDATKRREKVTMCAEYLLVDADDSVILAGINGVAADINGNPADGGTQSKAQQSKEKESTQEQADARGVLSLFGDNVSMTADEYASLIKQFGERGAKRMTEMLNNYKASTGKTYVNDYRAILSWVVRRWREEGGNSYERPTENYDHLAIDPFKDSG